MKSSGGGMLSSVSVVPQVSKCQICVGQLQYYKCQPYGLFESTLQQILTFLVKELEDAKQNMHQMSVSYLESTHPNNSRILQYPCSKFLPLFIKTLMRCLTVALMINKILFRKTFSHVCTLELRAHIFNFFARMNKCFVIYTQLHRIGQKTHPIEKSLSTVCSANKTENTYAETDKHAGHEQDREYNC